MINVVAAIIKNCEGKILITQRNLKKSQGGLWEFPGGKIEKGETREEAIIREIKEELTIEINVESYLGEKVFEYPEKSINLIALNCRVKSGNIYLTEHEEARWVEKAELNSFEFTPADIFIVKKLQGIEK
jgi:mutator mutT protein